MSSEQQLSEVLRQFAATMVTDFEIQDILDGFVDRTVEILPITSAGVTLMAPGVDPSYVAASNDAALIFEQLQTELGEGPCTEAYNTGLAVSSPDLRHERRFPAFVDRALEAGLGAVFAFPLCQGARRLGALDLYRESPGELTPAAQRAAVILADVAASYLLNAQARADLVDASAQSRYAALHDPLTGLPNRVLLLERLEHAFVRAGRSGRAPVVLFLDLDRFKDVNDTHGHRVGDQLLIAVAERLTRLLRTGDSLGRLSGDEFVILCEDISAPGVANKIVARIASSFSDPFRLSGLEIPMTASIGIATADRSDVNAEQLLHDADRAMYRGKRRRRAGSPVLDLRTEHLEEHQTSLGRDLAGVIGRGELHLDYQPIVDTIDGSVVGIEALLRWEHPVRGAVPPLVLIPLAEHSGLITSIGRWILERAWADRGSWTSRAPRVAGTASGGIGISVNVSAQQLMWPRFAESVAAVVETTGADPRLLTLEVTESVFVQDGERTMTVLADLKSIGVKVALDDFGTGYSSLSYLKRFPVDVVKIDRAFISDLGRDPPSHTIVAAVVKLAHDLGMTVTAEGVETAEQHRELDLLGCDSCQGYYFARPMSAANLSSLLRPHEDGSTVRLPAL